MIPEHMSYSALSRYEECPRSYYLGRVANAPGRQTWFFPIGTAVHNMIEDHLNGKMNLKYDPGHIRAEDYFYPLISEQMKVDRDDVNWLAGGSSDAPVIRAKALGLVKRCFENAVKFLEDIDVWEVEYDASGMIPGCEVEVKAFVDIVGEHKKYGPCIVDWKTGKQKPKNNLQLETYWCLLNLNEHPFNEHASLAISTGLWGMLNPDAAKARKIDLSGTDPLALGQRYQKAYDAIKKGIWKADSGFHCRFCTMAPNCLIEAGPTDRAKRYDKSEEDGFPY